MTKQLDQLLAQISQLPATDQRWILRQLSTAQRVALKKHNGVHRLQQALGVISLENPIDTLPDFSKQLALKAPLYTAIVMEQGDYPWKPLFLKQFDTNGDIQRLMDHEVLDIKPLVKNAVFQEWEASLSFDHFLDASHG